MPRTSHNQPQILLPCKPDTLLHMPNLSRIHSVHRRLTQVTTPLHGIQTRHIQGITIADRLRLLEERVVPVRGNVLTGGALGVIRGIARCGGRDILDQLAVDRGVETAPL